MMKEPEKPSAEPQETGLICAQADLRFGLNQFRRLARALNENCGLQAISSVYSVAKYNEIWEDWDRGLSVGFRVQTAFSSDHLLEFLLEQEQRLQKEAPRNMFQTYFLCLGQNVALLKHLNLPHPEFHRRPELLLPVCELFPDYRHPVLHQTLGELSRAFDGKKWGEFFAQGKSLLEPDLESHF